MNGLIQPAVFGATGYSGFELVRLLARHDGVKKPLLFQRNGDSGYGDLAEAYPQLAGNGGFPFESFSWQRMKRLEWMSCFWPRRTSSPVNWCPRRSAVAFA